MVGSWSSTSRRSGTSGCRVPCSHRPAIVGVDERVRDEFAGAQHDCVGDRVVRVWYEAADLAARPPGGVRVVIEWQFDVGGTVRWAGCHGVHLPRPRRFQSAGWAWRHGGGRRPVRARGAALYVGWCSGAGRGVLTGRGTTTRGRHACRRAWSTAQRVAAVEATGLLDSDPDESFDQLARLAAAVLGVPWVFVTLVDEHRSFWVSAVGVDPDPGSGLYGENPVDDSFCQYVIAADGPVIIDDARLDRRSDGTRRSSRWEVVAWAGFPLRSTDGYVVGTFCAVDRFPASGRRRTSRCSTRWPPQRRAICNSAPPLRSRTSRPASCVRRWNDARCW